MYINQIFFFWCSISRTRIDPNDNQWDTKQTFAKHKCSA